MSEPEYNPNSFNTILGGIHERLKHIDEMTQQTLRRIEKTSETVGLHDRSLIALAEDVDELASDVERLVKSESKRKLEMAKIAGGAAVAGATAGFLVSLGRWIIGN